MRTVTGKSLNLILLLALFTFILWPFAREAEARRLGGGKSFGSKPSYQQSAPKPANRDINSGQTQRVNPQTTAPGRFGGLGGMFGGLLMGGLIGSLLFGGAGATGGPGLLDILVIGGILFFVVRLLRARRTAATQAAGDSPFGNPGQGRFPGFGDSGVRDPLSEKKTLAQSLPPGFDADEFLNGAKAAYSRLQEAWGKRDFADIKHFTSPEVLQELKSQAENDPVPAPVEIILVQAQLMDVQDHGDERTASVYFDVMMREDMNQENTTQAKEIWHFKRNKSDSRSFWVLDGIQQVE
ncbi:MAG: Tim44 domain-containing protein [Desulfobacteraceae bacterium]|jgi:predicted lipid-binding transport protein (Tim44 family)|nr:MAG: Tim44 domain-containing protein [Desulfobacteraceae bacterium]